MQEDHQNADRTDIAHAEEIDAKETATERLTVGELLTDQFLGHIPAHEQTGEEASYRKEQLSRGEIEEVEEAQAKQLQLRTTERQGAEDADESTEHRNDACRLLT